VSSSICNGDFNVFPMSSADPHSQYGSMAYSSLFIQCSIDVSWVYWGFVSGDMGKDVKVINWGRRDGSAGDDIGGTVGDVEEGIVFRIIEDWPGELGGGGTWDKRSGCWGSVSVKIGTWEIPSIMVRLEDFEDGSGGVSGVLLIYIIKGRPRGDGVVGEGGGDDGSGL